jgi:diadenosine tetraphosphate (Ap4A) HIT family hydrolase
MGDGTEFYARPWRDPDRWRALLSGEACPICADHTPPEVVVIAEMEASFLTTEEGAPFRGYCCLVLKRHAVELHDLGEEEAASLMEDMRRTSRALQEVTGAVKINVDIHGNTMPHLHAHFFPRYVGDPYEDGPIDFRRAEDTAAFTYDPGELRRFVENLRSAVGAD